jgi:hypothetical protein
MPLEMLHHHHDNNHHHRYRHHHRHHRRPRHHECLKLHRSDKILLHYAYLSLYHLECSGVYDSFACI